MSLPKNLDPSILLSLAGFPAGTPPEGVIANFKNPYTLAPLLYWMGSVFTLIMVCFVTAGIYHKGFLIRRFT
jgi:hypothetical protein